MEYALASVTLLHVCAGFRVLWRAGSSVDAAELIRNFLGRDATPDAFLKSKGLAV
jgi:Zn-dependent oligopeptidase